MYAITYIWPAVRRGAAPLPPKVHARIRVPQHRAAVDLLPPPFSRRTSNSSGGGRDRSSSSSNGSGNVPLAARFPPQCGGCRDCRSTARGGRRTDTLVMVSTASSSAARKISSPSATISESLRETPLAKTSIPLLNRERAVLLLPPRYSIFLPRASFSLGTRDTAVRATPDNRTGGISRFYCARTEGVRAIWPASGLTRNADQAEKHLLAINARRGTSPSSDRARHSRLAEYSCCARWIAIRLSPRTFNFGFQLFRTVLDVTAANQNSYDRV